MSVSYEDTAPDGTHCGYEVQSSESVGRRLVATRDTSAGEVVMRALPLATGPVRGEQAPCLVCYRPLDEDACHCPDCGWPMCSQSCCTHARHAPECLATAASGVKVSFEDPTRWDSLYDCIIVLRCLSLRISSPSSWNHIQLMETHDSIRRLPNHRRRSEALAALFTARFGHAYGATVADILRIIATLEINAMEVTSEGRSLQAIYPEAIYAEHSCVPTAFRVFGSPEEGFPLVIRAAVDIAKNSPISLTYTDSLWGTLERRTHLYYSKLFLCNCERCSDREELGSCLTGLKCKKCGDCVLPNTPLSERWLKGAKAESSEKWSCRSCKKCLPGKIAREIAWDATETIKELEDDEDAGIERYKMVLEMLLQSLHSRHSLVVDLKHSILHILNPPESLSDEQLMTKEKFAREPGSFLGDCQCFGCFLCNNIPHCPEDGCTGSSLNVSNHQGTNLAEVPRKKVIEVANILFPGISLLKGTCLYELASTLMEKKLRKLNDSNQLGIIKEAEKALEESIYHLHFQTKCQPEHQLLTEAKEKLKRITEMRNRLKNNVEDIPLAKKKTD